MSTQTLKLPRSPLWPELRRRWLNDHPTCAACGGKKNIEVHHKVPVHVSRSMELDPTNLITLCESNLSLDATAEKHCHLLIGHLGNWYAYNKHVDKSAYDALLETYKINPQSPAAAELPQPTTVALRPADTDPARAADPATHDAEVKLEQFTRRTRRQ